MSSTTFETRWWHQDPETGKVVCTLCPRQCHIKEGSRGFCFVRANVDGELVLTTYGRSSGFCIDPIEKKPLNHFLPGTPVLSLGTAGCNLGCKFCQNWDISKSREMDTLAGKAGPEAIVEAAKQTGSRSIAFTYNDPTIWAEYAIDIAKLARQEGIETVAVTAAYISPEARGEFYQHMDAANIDFKAFTETFYRKLTQTHIEPVLDTLKFLKNETNVWFELTELLIPTENDSEDEIKRLCDWVVENLGPDVPIHFTKFHPEFKMQNYPHTPHETLIRARRIALDAGIRFAYVGNVYDVKRQSTHCPGCGELLIERDWYELGRYKLAGSWCPSCGESIPGVFETAPGNWGRRRMPVRIRDDNEYVPAGRGEEAEEDRLADPDQAAHAPV
jgi:pyruvate formate lyase activating enzyme